METLTLQVPESLLSDLEPYRDNLESVLKAGLRQIKLENALVLLKHGDVSLWKAARLAGISLREMTQQAVAHGLRPTLDSETLDEELAAWSS